jgi:hypothetical protein
MPTADKEKAGHAIIGFLSTTLGCSGELAAGIEYMNVRFAPKSGHR